jgi:hypothetical protein
MYFYIVHCLVKFVLKSVKLLTDPEAVTKFTKRLDLQCAISDI